LETKKQTSSTWKKCIGMRWGESYGKPFVYSLRYMYTILAGWVMAIPLCVVYQNSQEIALFHPVTIF